METAMAIDAINLFNCLRLKLDLFIAFGYEGVILPRISIEPDLLADGNCRFSIHDVVSEPPIPCQIPDPKTICKLFLSRKMKLFLFGFLFA
jgi:hypothetical protein